MVRRPPLPPFPPGAWLVGGAVRDWALGRAPKDFDWVVPDPESAAHNLAANLAGSAFALDAERGFWRVVAGGVQHDLVPLPEDLDADLRRRDFTVNALALDARRRLHDPLGGRLDLWRRRLRMVSEANLRDDPLRAWRGVRLELTRGLRLERHTLRAAQRVALDLAAGQLPRPAPERVRDELTALLSHPQAARGVARLEEVGLLALCLPELREGQGLEQGGFHHLDVFAHGLEALHQLLARQPQAPVALRWAALLHDVAKPRTLSVDPQTGRRRFHGHAREGAALTTQMLERLRLPGDVVRRASRLVGAHMLPLPAGEREARRFVHRQRELLPDLLSLMLADREAARGPSSTPATRRAYALGLERVLAAMEEPPPAAPLLRGQDVMELLGCGPGPQVGAALRALAEAAALGEVRTPEEARAFVTRGAPWTGQSVPD